MRRRIIAVMLGVLVLLYFIAPMLHEAHALVDAPEPANVVDQTVKTNLTVNQLRTLWFEYDNKIKPADIITVVTMIVAVSALIINGKNLRRTILNKRADVIVSIVNQYYADPDTSNLLQSIKIGTFELANGPIEFKAEGALMRLLIMLERIASLYRLKIITRRELRLVGSELLQVYRNQEVQRFVSNLRSFLTQEDRFFCETFWDVAREIHERRRLRDKRKKWRKDLALQITERSSNIFPVLLKATFDVKDHIIDGWRRFEIPSFSNDIGIDLGTTNTFVYVRDHGVVLREPSLVAVKAGTDMVLAVGIEARRMLGRTPANIVAVRPLRDGSITDSDITEAVLRHFIIKAQHGLKWRRPRVVISVSSSTTQIEKRAMKEAATSAGAREVYLIDEIMAAAIGVGLPVQDAAGNMIINIGGGTTEVALITLSGIVFSRSVRVAGDELDEAIVDYVKRAYNLMIGVRTAEEIKIKIGSAFPPDHEDKETSMEIKGRDLGTGLPKTLTITSQEVREALMEPMRTIVESVRITLERCPPELASDLVDRGIVLAGGGALLRGLDQLLMNETGLPIHVAEDPLSAVAEGTGKVLNEIKFLRQVASMDREWR